MPIPNLCLGDTRFATAVIMLSRFLELANDLEQAVDDPRWRNKMVLPRRRAADAAGAPVLAGAQGHVRGRRPSGRQREVLEQAAEQQAVQQQAAQAQAAAAKEHPAVVASRIREIIKDEELAQQMRLIVDVCQPIVQLLRYADSKQPGIGKIYHRCYMLQQWVDAMLGDQEAIDMIIEQKTAAAKMAGKEPTEEDLYIPVIGPELGEPIKVRVRARYVQVCVWLLECYFPVLLDLNLV